MSRDTRFVDVLLTFLILGCFLNAARCQQGSAEPWDKSPANSVYEQQEKNAAAVDSPSETHSPDENNVMESLKRDSKDDEEEAEEEGVYEDEYEVEEEHEVSDDKFSKQREKSSSASTEDASREEDYVEDPSTSQYDAYYYYDDYDNHNRSRYEAVANADALDYPDGEEEEKETREKEEEEEARSRDEHNVPDEKDEGNAESRLVANSNDSSSDLFDEKDLDTPISTTNNEEGSSMEGSDKTFAFLGPETNSSILIGEAVVSVVTTKSVVNGTISVPTTSSPTSTEQVAAPPSSSTTEQPLVTTEDTSRLLASVQTSRSISGARFLPFPVIDRVEPIDKKTSLPPESTESIIDKLDRVQSELSSGFLTGGFQTSGNTLQLDVLNERDRNSRRKYTTTAKTPVIGKFVPRRYNDKRTDSATPKPKFETTLDSLEGLLPRDFLARSSTQSVPKTGFRWPTKSTTSTTTEATTIQITSTTTTKKPKTNVIAQDISALLPPGYKLKKEDTVTESSLLSDILAKSKVDISSLLPPDYNKNKEKNSSQQTTSTTTTTTKSIEEKSPAEKSIQDLFAKSKFDISSLLPQDYEQKSKNLTSNSTESDDPTTKLMDSTESASSTTSKPGLKIVFPSRPGGRKPIQKISTPPTPRGEGPGAVTLKIQKGWPTRATTEFTGWPTPSTTPISIEKLLEAARTATISSASLIPITETTSSTSTTSTTTTTPRPTTPGICERECEVAGTIKIIGNASWVPELLDRNTQEWQKLAREIEQEMNFIFAKSAVLAKWYKKIRIDSFSEGSILVDYFIELAELEQKVNTQELKVIFHDSLRTFNANRWNETRTKSTIRLGSFTIDPKYTDFIVIPKAVTPHFIEKEDRLIPQWAIAVIVIGVGGLVFIIIFGVSVLINRHNRSKLKPSISTIYEEEIAKNTHRPSDYSKPVHTIWTDPDVSWNDKSFESTSNKIFVEKPFQDNKKYNMYDSWRSEWNGYYCNESHASSKYGGYDSTTNLSCRPDHDTNFFCPNYDTNF
ncbi:nuclear pore complex protein DDB_G0274915 [Ceratina calcarata]|uniref:Nuclear pore complex protein DDB_G0274915 n=1 Tax=Ceratina calcarata TaxID=156304 RepID=A0AAJ7J9T8_9HYME|nr:nuclear pore complex protein DDB_G0274915 [Ceratina calcarata]